jgi:hypothetical protein
VLGPEFGDDGGKRALIIWVLYGLNYVGASFMNHLPECMTHFGWKPCFTDRNLWMKAETHPDDGMLYCAYMLIYVDDILCVRHDAKLDEYFKMKEGAIQVPTFYLGVKLKKTVLPNGMVAWGVSSSKYVQSTVKKVQ